MLRAKPDSSSQDSATFAAEAGIAALSYLAEDEERLSRFLALSGLGPRNLRQAAAEPNFLGAVLDYLASDDRLLVAFAASRNMTPERVMRARDALVPRTPDWP